MFQLGYKDFSQIILVDALTIDNFNVVTLIVSALKINSNLSLIKRTFKDKIDLI